MNILSSTGHTWPCVCLSFTGDEPAIQTNRLYRMQSNGLKCDYIFNPRKRCIYTHTKSNTHNVFVTPNCINKLNCACSSKYIGRSEGRRSKRAKFHPALCLSNLVEYNYQVDEMDYGNCFPILKRAPATAVRRTQKGLEFVWPRGHVMLSIFR